jgi:predicted site-specific integrase-resolvase
MTAYNRYKKGTIRGVQLETGTILVENNIEVNKITNNVALYSRVSSNDRKSQLNDQSERLLNYAISNGYNITENVKEIASGMNDNINTIIVENKDRLTRFGFNYLEILLNKKDVNIIVVNKSYNKDEDLMKDFISIVTSFCGRIYGKRKSKQRKEKIIDVLNEGIN